MPKTVPLFERLTPLNLSMSQKSETCPACGHAKRRMLVFCDECRALVPEPVLEPLMRSIAEGTADSQQRAMHAAFVALGVTTWHPPKPQPTWAGTEDKTRGKRAI